MSKIKCMEMLINSVKDQVEKVKVNIPVMTVHHFIALNNCSLKSNLNQDFKISLMFISCHFSLWWDLMLLKNRRTVW